MSILLNENNISLKVGAQAPTKWYIGTQQIYNNKQTPQIFGISETSNNMLWSRGYIYSSDGTSIYGQTDEYNYYYTPGYIPCTPNTVYVLDRITTDKTWVWANMCFYDANKTFISASILENGSQTAGGTAYTFISSAAPSNAAFMRISLSGPGKVLFNTYDVLNISNFSAWTQNSYLDTNGNIVQAANYSASPFISVEGINRLTFHYGSTSGRTWQGYLFYDSNQTLLSYTDEYTNNFLYISVPTNAKYIRLSCARVQVGDTGNILINSSDLI